MGTMKMQENGCNLRMKSIKKNDIIVVQKLQFLNNFLVKTAV
jgi:hypothetical protein